MVMDSYKGIFVSLYDVEKDFTILYFWEPDCGHCKEAHQNLRPIMINQKMIVWRFLQCALHLIKKNGQSILKIINLHGLMDGILKGAHILIISIMYNPLPRFISLIKIKK